VGTVIRNLDLSLSKEFKIREGKAASGAAETFNASTINASPSRIWDLGWRFSER